MKDRLRNLYRFLSSYGLSCVLFFLLFRLTLMGTLEQIHLGLFDVQKKYFESVFLIHELFGVLPIPLPGAYLVMSALAVNLFLGGIVRARKGPAHWGVLLGHIAVSYTHLRAHGTVLELVCRLLLEQQNHTKLNT